MIVFSLDLAGVCGYAVDGLQSACPPRTGAYSLHGGGADRGAAYLKFDEWLWTVLGQFNVDLVSYEAPIIGGIPTGMHEALLLIGLAGHVEAMAASRGIPSMDPPPAVSTIRKWFAGNGYAKKPEVMAKCDSLGWDYGRDHNRADAAALWAYTKHKKEPGFQLETSPLLTAVKAARSVA